MDGVLIIDKPGGPTSHDVVVRVRHAIGVQRIGHTGTLDPLASGVLPLLVGRAVRLAQFLSNAEKEYEAIVKLGIETDTYDVTGQTLHRSSQTTIDQLSSAQIENVLQRFRGSFFQQPPAFSAKKVAGSRAHRLARRGLAVKLNSSTVEVRRLEVLGRDGDRLTIRVTCSAGFYVRSLAHDIGAELGTGACLLDLRRLRSGEFGLNSAVPLDGLERDPAMACQRLVPMSHLLPAIPGVTLTSAGARRAASGNHIGEDDLATPAMTAGGRVRLLDPQGQLIAIAEPSERPGVLHPSVVLV